LEKVIEDKRGLSRIKKIKKLLKKVQRARGELTKIRMLLLFELEKELDEDIVKKGQKYDKILAR